MTDTETRDGTSETGLPVGTETQQAPNRPQAASSLAQLLVEMQSLFLLMPVTSTQPCDDHATEDEIEQSFNNMPV